MVGTTLAPSVTPEVPATEVKPVIVLLVPVPVRNAASISRAVRSTTNWPHHAGDGQHAVANELVGDPVAALEALEGGREELDLREHRVRLRDGDVLGRHADRGHGGQLGDGERVALGVEHARAGGEHDAAGL
jgi:hypothetical protein